MGKRNRKKPKEQIIKYEYNNISQERMIEMQAEAYYRALKKIEQEKTSCQEQEQEKTKNKWYMKVLLILNVIFWPWKINSKFSINNQMYDSILVFFVSVVLQLVGTSMWVLGVIAIVFAIYQMIAVRIAVILWVSCCIGLLLIMLGSMFVLSGENFSQEEDSNKIYAYSASIIAMLSCVVSIIALLKK